MAAYSSPLNGNANYQVHAAGAFGVRFKAAAARSRATPISSFTAFQFPCSVDIFQCRHI
jgi:hypothetical protein